MAPTSILISGGNRGLGKGLVSRYLAKSNHIVVAATRNPDHATSKALLDLPKAQGSRLVVVKIDSTIDTDPAEAVKFLAKEGIESLDIVVANAGICELHPFVSTVDAADLLKHTTTNVLGIIWLYQATLPLLRRSPVPKWVTMGSNAGSIQATMAHWFTKRMNAEEEGLTAFVVDPDWADTDMGRHGAVLLGLERAPVDPDDSCDGVVSVLDKATKETHGGLFLSYKGEQQAW